MKILCFWANVIACTQLLVCGGNALAFEGYEHRTIGDLAFNVAADIFKGPRGETTDLDKVRSRMCVSNQTAFQRDNPRNKPANEQQPLSYGDIAQCVDVLLSPEYLFVRTLNRKPVKTSPFDVSWNELGYHSRQCQVGTLPFTTPLFGRVIRASHNNHAHFGGHLITSLQMYHFMAVSLARNGSLDAALAANAIADHYLQDFFAPGHLATPRDALNDVNANELHDAMNVKGQIFQVDWSNVAQDMRRTASAALTRFQESGKDEMTSMLILPPPLANEGDGGLLEKTWAVARNVNNDLPDNCKTNFDRHRRNFEKFSKDSRAAWVTLRKWLNEVATDMKGVIESANSRTGGPDAAVGRRDETTTAILMHGDDLLWREWRECPVLSALIKKPDSEVVDQDALNGCKDKVKAAMAQRLMMVIAGAQSITEVLDAFSGKAAASKSGSFGMTLADNWKNKPAKKYAEWNEPYVMPQNTGLKFGKYNAKIADNVATAGHDYSDAHPSATLRKRNMPIGISFARESMTSNDVGRWMFGIELEPLWKLHDSTATPRNQAVGLGLLHYREGARTGTGVGGRYSILIWPDTESRLSFYARRLQHRDNESVTWRNGYGARIDFGFTTMTTGFFGIGKDYGFDSSGKLQRGTVLFGGLNLALPLTRWPGLGGAYRKWVETPKAEDSSKEE